jgi:hypothetical protein
MSRITVVLWLVAAVFGVLLVSGWVARPPF